MNYEWLGKLLGPKCGSSRWYHVIKQKRVEDTGRWVLRVLQEESGPVVHTSTNPTVNEYTHRNDRGTAIEQLDRKGCFK